MRTKVISIIIFIGLLSGFAYCQEKNNDLKKMNLYGKVLSIREISYKALIKSEEIFKGEKERERFGEEDKYIRFNKYGNIIEDISFNTKGGLTLKDTYKYDHKQKKIERTGFGPSNNITSKETYEYDDRGNCIVENCIIIGFGTYEVTYLYDLKGNKIAAIYNEDNHISKTTYKYDNSGNIIECNDYGSGNNLSNKMVDKYDNRGNNIEHELYWSDGKTLKYKWVRKYDDKDNLIEEIKYYPNGDVDYKKTNKYEFDESDNWIKKVTIENQIPTFILERTIEYYDI